MGQLKRLITVQEFRLKTDYHAKIRKIKNKCVWLLVQLKGNYDTKTIETVSKILDITCLITTCGFSRLAKIVFDQKILKETKNLGANGDITITLHTG